MITKFKIVEKKRYELLESIAERTDDHIIQIKNDIKKIDSLKNEVEDLETLVKNILMLFQDKENQRKKSVSKIVGLQTSLIKEKTKIKELLKYQSTLENKMQAKDLELKTKDAEIKILRQKGKKKNTEDYKNYFECRKELEKRSRDEK